MSKVFSFLLCGTVIFLIGYAFIKERRASEVVSPSSQFVIPANKMEALQLRAKSGDCDAAYMIGRHHSFFTLQVDEAIKWFRLAAKCPNVKSKEELISYLLIIKDQPGIDAEIDNLIVEIKKIDPVAVMKSQEEVLRQRKTAGRTLRPSGQEADQKLSKAP